MRVHVANTQASVGLRPNKHGRYKHRTVIPPRSLGDHQAQIVYAFQIQSNIRLKGSCDIPLSHVNELIAQGEALFEFCVHFQTVAKNLLLHSCAGTSIRPTA